ncbi:heterokaryon incompatibility protein-domain-containing protein [Nemania sp. NC0429]|nr:heterokaryon incompatibility protein-domain-containing protein [Nemania sp. NC0429]
MSDSSDTCRSEEATKFDEYRGSARRVVIESHNATDDCSQCYPQRPPRQTADSLALGQSLSLCHTCVAQDFNSPMLIKWRLALDQILQEEHCRFCRLIAYCVLNDEKLERRVFHANNPSDFEVYCKCSRVQGSEQIFLCIGKSNTFDVTLDERNRQTGRPLTIEDMDRDRWAAVRGDFEKKHCLWMTPGAGIPFWALQVDYGQQQEAWTRIRSGVSYSIQVIDHWPKDFAYGQPVERPTQASFAQLKRWLADCQATHDACAKPPDDDATPLPKSFRLIDVEKKCIVLAPPNPRYLALSYVWGTANTILLKQHNYDELHSEGALRGGLLPKTIQDALTLCSNLGERYLWVDALCIIQDGSEDKMEQINAMDAVYSRAHVTVVAAEADDANGGMPPVNGSRIVRYLAHDVGSRMMVATLCPQAATTPRRLGRLKWATRAWTFQEYALSKRVLLITNDLIFWRCEGFRGAENVFFDEQAMQPQNPLKTHSVYLPLTSLPAVDSSPRDFARFLGQYILRNMTDQSDILKAFTGVLNYLQPRFGPSHWGLPARLVDSSLSWRFTSHKSRNQWYTADEFHSTVELPVRREGFPSWTWAGWFIGRDPNQPLRPNDIGITLEHQLDRALHGPSTFEDRSYGHQPLLTIYNMTQEGDVILLSEERRKVSERFSIRSHVTPPEHADRDISQFYSLIDSGVTGPPIDHILFFWTSITEFVISKDPLSTRISISGKRIGRYQIKTTRKNWFSTGKKRGEVELEVDWRTRQPSSLPFIVVSAVVAPNPYGNPNLPPDLSYNLLLVEKLNMGQMTVYRRVNASNQISVLDHLWTEVKPRRELIALA